LLSFIYPVIINHPHEYKDWILPQCVFPLPDSWPWRDTRNHLWPYTKEREDKTLRGVIQIFIHGSSQLSTRTWWSSVTWQLSTRDLKQTKSEPIPQSVITGLTVTPESRGLVRRGRNQRTWVHVNVRSVGVGRVCVCVVFVSGCEDRECGVGVGVTDTKLSCLFMNR
jgi:hypothetical protein